MDALVGYGVDNFIKAFYEKLGKAYMEKHEKGLRLFLESVQGEIPIILTRMNMALKNFNSVKGESKKIQIGDIVCAVYPFVFSHGYKSAICVSLDPFVLISSDGDMLWRTTVTQNDVKPIAKATSEEMSVVMERFKREYKIPPL